MAPDGATGSLNKTISVLIHYIFFLVIGTNNIGDGMSVNDCTKEYNDMVTETLKNQRGAHMYIFEIPPRLSEPHKNGAR